MKSNPVFKNICKGLLQLLYPRVCPLCGEILAPARRNHPGQNPYICPDCYPLLHFPTEPRCMKCSRPLSDRDEERSAGYSAGRVRAVRDISGKIPELCRDCSRERRDFDSGIALMMHDDAAKKILYDLKYSNRRDHADMLASEAAYRYHELIKFWHPDAMIPVPLHRSRELKRGFNQAEVLARKLSQYLAGYGLDIPVNSRLLARIRHTDAQKELSRAQRIGNIRGAFCLNTQYQQISGKKPVQLPKTVLLVDDIYTSGATLSECAGVLKAAGISRVYFLTFSIG